MTVTGTPSSHMINAGILISYSRGSSPLVNTAKTDESDLSALSERRNASEDVSFLQAFCPGRGWGRSCGVKGHCRRLRASLVVGLIGS